MNLPDFNQINDHLESGITRYLHARQLNLNGLSRNQQLIMIMVNPD